MKLHLLLADYDGKTVERLESILETHPPDSDRLLEALELSAAADEDVAAGASWLFDRYLRAGAEAPPEVVASLADLLDDVAAPIARLHICQAVGHLRIPPESAETFEGFLEECCRNDNTFVRAWAMDGYWRLAQQHPRYEATARRLIEAGLADPKASVRARARRIAAEAG